MSKKVLIAITMANSYILQGTVLQNTNLIQQGVFPTTADHQQSRQPQATAQTFANRVDSFRYLATDPVASVFLCFNVKDMLRISGSQPVEWTGSLADLYDPETGFYDIEHTFKEPFNVGNISEPVGFDNISVAQFEMVTLFPLVNLKPSLQHIRQLTFVVPDFDDENLSYLWRSASSRLPWSTCQCFVFR